MNPNLLVASGVIVLLLSLLYTVKTKSSMKVDQSLNQEQVNRKNLTVGDGFRFGFGFGAGIFVWGVLIHLVVIGILWIVFQNISKDIFGTLSL